MGLKIDDLSVQLGGSEILFNISAAFEPGRICAILGPNGAGKSTLLSVITGLIGDHSGQILLEGQPLNTLKPDERARKMAYLPQNYKVAWDILVHDVVAMGRFAHDDTDAEAINHAMELTDTVRFARRTTGQLSGGELARVMLARVLAGQPDWILADEPLASLDPAYQLDLVTRFREIAAAGTAVLVVLHDINLAAKLADDVLMLKDGRLLEGGTAKECLTAANLSKLYDIPVLHSRNGIFHFD